MRVPLPNPFFSSSACTRRAASSIKGDGNDTSYLNTLPPMDRSATGMCSLSIHNSEQRRESDALTASRVTPVDSRKSSSAATLSVSWSPFAPSVSTNTKYRASPRLLSAIHRGNPNFLPVASNAARTAPPAAASKYSTAESTSPSRSRAALNTRMVSSKVRQLTTETVCAAGSGCSFKHTRVMIPSVPSEPTNIWLKSYPVLSLRIRFTLSSTVPSASATWSPSTLPLSEPYRTTRSPPAFVATFPPTWHDALAPRSSGTTIPLVRANESHSSSVNPASATSVCESASASSSVRNRCVDSTTSVEMGTPPPTNPVFPPCGTTGIKREAQYRKHAAASAAEAGRTTTRLRPRYAPVQSTLNLSTTDSSVATLEHAMAKSLATATGSKSSVSRGTSRSGRVEASRRWFVASFGVVRWSRVAARLRTRSGIVAMGVDWCCDCPLRVSKGSFRDSHPHNCQHTPHQCHHHHHHHHQADNRCASLREAWTPHEIWLGALLCSLQGVFVPMPTLAALVPAAAVAAAATTATTAADPHVTAHVPLWLRPLLNDEGKVVYDGRRTVAYRVLGAPANERLVKLIGQTPARLLAYCSVLVVSVLFIFLGLMRVVPLEVFIAAFCTTVVWTLVHHAVCDDLFILRRVSLRDVDLWTNVALTLLGGVSFAAILDYDARGVLFLLYFLVGVVSSSLSDTWPPHTVVGMCLVYAALSGLALLTLALVNFSLIPGMRPAPTTLFTIGLSTVGFRDIPIDAYSVFNASVWAFFVLVAKESILRFNGRKHLEFRAAVVRLQAVQTNFPEDFAYLDVI